MELQGTIKRIGEIQTFASGFQKKELTILTQEQYPQPINIEFFSDKIDLLNGLKEPFREKKILINMDSQRQKWIMQEQIFSLKLFRIPPSP